MFFRFYNWLKTSAVPTVLVGSPGPTDPVCTGNT